ncbi:restriction endonuclease [Saccharothrix sp. AJ9571]|nr:restriction endonuclease [Saccharothrix sp. AJ9571]
MIEPLFQDTDPELDKVKAVLLATPDVKRRAALAIRRTLNMLLDGPNTGRYRWDQLHKTEKTHCGTLVEINLQREFNFTDGDKLDYSIADIDVDCKYSHGKSWMIPPEAFGKLCMVVAASDQDGVWSLGIVRARNEYLNAGRNRDVKATLNLLGRDNIRWLFQDAPLPENVLLRLAPADIEAIFSKPSGQRRLKELFLRAQGRIIRRAVVGTVAQQLDFMRRARSGGGARDLADRGVVVLGQYGLHQKAAAGLGLPVPGDGEFVSARLVPYQPHHGDRGTFTDANGTKWVVALPSDPAATAPQIPHKD